MSVEAAQTPAVESKRRSTSETEHIPFRIPFVVFGALHWLSSAANSQNTFFGEKISNVLSKKVRKAKQNTVFCGQSVQSKEFL